DPGDIASALRPNTAMIVLNHASNVVGTLLPVLEVGRIARAHGALLLVDAAQTGGAYPVDMEADGIDLLAFTGHKSLYGPMGTGGLIFGSRMDPARIEPLKRGGTGSRSELEEQPGFLPDRFESGTLNVVGLAGLEAGIRWVLAQGVEAIRQHEQALTQQLIDGLLSIQRVAVYGTRDSRQQVACVSFDVDGLDPSDVARRLDDEHDVLCRSGLHCAPAAHRTIGTFPRGSVRFGLGAMNTSEQITRAIQAVTQIARGCR
ncbi:MAG: aminotransferase class V-fold PLP-dependent enzyme, partial [Chloroflexi bacterium]|nr:aminotransferase class V-fold PLP-dependent enzyme [Chloroflexota bacterium]